MKKMDYPQLYIDASNASASGQGKYFQFLQIEYFVLLMAAIFENAGPYLSDGTRFAGFLFCIATAGLFLIRNHMLPPERKWYQCRALAESIKTLSWKYMMRADPFDSAAVQESNNLFAERVSDSFETASEYVVRSPTRRPGHITKFMSQMRDESLENRREFYIEHRLHDQFDWYTSNAEKNGRKATILVTSCIIVYAVAIVLAAANLTTLYNPDWHPIFSASSPIASPLIVVATAILGWIQAQRNYELQQSFSKTSLEIDKILSKFGLDVMDESEFSVLVCNAELAFSREHTQWAARQTGK